jgi:hypothetical protein
MHSKINLKSCPVCKGKVGKYILLPIIAMLFLMLFKLFKKKD